MSESLEPGRTSPELTEAMGLFRAGRLREAERACRRTLAADPQHARALHLLALIADRAGRRPEAVGLARRAAASAPDDAVVHHSLGDLLLSAGSAADAISAYQRAHALDPTSPFILASLGNVWWRGNELAKAEHAYREALKLKPDYAGAHNNLGNVLLQQGRRSEAETCYRRAIALDPRDSGLRLNLARLLEECGRSDEARRELTGALAQGPDNPHVQAALARISAKRNESDASPAATALEGARASGAPAASPEDAVQTLFARAHGEQAQGRLKEAEATCRQLLALDPDHPGAWHLLGIVTLRAGDAAAALAHIERAAALAPQKADVRNSRGFALRAMGQDTDAEAAFREAVALDANFLEAHYQLGNLLREAKRHSDAEASYHRVLALNPDHVQAHNNLGAALGEQRRFEEAAEHFRRATELRPGYAEAHSNLAHALRAIGQPEEAEAACRRAIALAPRLAVAHLNLGLALQDTGRMDEALASFRRASTLDPGYHMATACEGMLHLLRGNLAAGWEKYEARWSIGDLLPRDFKQPQWRGEPLDGKTILLHAEQGFGDTIQFLRYLPLVAARGGNIVLEIQKPLVPLVTRIAGLEVIARGAPLPPFDFHCPLLSLPRAFATTLQNLPASMPYLAASPERVAHWRARIGNEPGLKVGIAWAGSPIHRNDRHRSIPIERLKPLFELAGARFFSLQVGARSADLTAVEPVPVTDLAGELTDFGETAAAVANLDLIISADTALVHLAGALNKPVWTLLPFAPDWRWLLARGDSPWYPSMRLFRQSKVGDWEGVIAAVRQALVERIAGAPKVPEAARRAEYVSLVAAANEHHQAKRHVECEAALRRALDIDPANASALHVLALTRHALDDKNEAIDLMHKAVAREPASANFLRDLAIMLHSARRFDEALDTARRAAALNPEDATTHNSIGATLAELGRPAEAIDAFRRALDLKPNYHEAWANMAHSQQALLKLDEAADSYRRALGIRHDYVEGHVSAAMLALLRGDYANGFTEFEWRWRLKIMTPRGFKQPAWQGEPLNGKTILLHAEQGFGDTVQCLRFVPEVVARGGRLLLELPLALMQLATTLQGGGEIVPLGRALPEFDVHCAFMSLPRVLGVTLDNLKDRPVPYLRADPAAVERWARRLAGTGSGLRVGIAWAGNPKHAADSRRSIAVERLTELTRVAGVRFYSFQVGERAQDLALLPADKVLDLSRELTNFAETAAALANLDLVLSVDTALVHLAGALGRPCWAMLPFSPDWRWLTERSDSPWYPSLRLFRQASPGAWDEVFARVGGALSELAGARRPSGPPLDARKLYAQAVALREGKRGSEAETIARRILASQPDNRPTLNLLGVLRNEAGDAKEAADVFARLVELSPDDAEAPYNLAVVLGTLERYDEAIVHYRRAIAINPGHAKAHSNLGSALRLRGRLDEAEAACRRALDIDPSSASAHINLGTVFTSREQLDEAVQSFRRATELKPDMAEAFLNLGLALHNRGEFEEALTQYRRATNIRLDYADAHMAEAFALLTLQRDFPEALTKLEWRWRLADRKPRGFAQPLWLGEPLAGKTILLHAEQGFGDSLMLLRYAPMVAARGGRVVIEVPKALVRLAKSLAGGQFPVIAEGSALPAFDVHCPLMSLPLALRTTPETIPSQVPYLSAAPEDIRRWKEQLGDAPGLKIGIAWAGNPHHRNDERRSIPLDRLAALFDVPGVRWFSLQVGARAGDLASLPPGRVNDLSPQLTDFAETAAAVANLDLVISADTAPAHLAGALGKPVWVLLPFNPDWRWFAARADSPWYPTARLFRQNKPGDWESAIAAVRGALGAQTTAATVPSPRTDPPMLDRRYFAAVELIEAGRDAEATAVLKAILDEDSGHAPALRRMAWMCHKRGDNTEAARMLVASLEREPNNPETHHNLGLVLATLGRNKEAEDSYRRGLALKPNSVDGHNNLGVLLESVGRYDEAEESYRRAIAIAPTVPHPHNNLGVLFKESGRLAESLAAHRRVVELDPRLAAGRSNLLYTLNYDETVSPEAIYAEHVAWGQSEAVRFPIAGSRFANVPDAARRLRVGYVSGDFRHHSVAFFVAPLLEAHDRGAGEIFLYSNNARADATTARLKARADHWVPIHHLSDEQAAARIRADAIDILVDLSGHTSHNRMTLFARKPAPIAVSWLGYPNTTGLPAIDYRVTDVVADPPGEADRLHTERLVRLAAGFLCYGAPQDAPPVAPLPALAAGHVTFGSFNNVAKLSPSTVALWARILREVPDAKLLLKASQFKDAGTRARVAGAFAAAGIARERIIVLPPQATTADHLAAYAQVDIALDPLPYNGTATTCEALWMGVPVVTLRGERHAGRVGASILTALGIENLIAQTPDEYIATAAKLAHDRDALAALRANLRERMRASPLCDSTAFARTVEDAYRVMWRDWCHAHGAPSKPGGAVRPASVIALDTAEAAAQRLFDANSLDEAEAMLRRLLDRDPRRAMAWFLLGRVRHTRGDRDAAIDFMRKAIAFDPKLAPPHNDLGIMLQAQGRLDEAEACYRRAVEINGRFAEAMSNLGAVLAARGRLDDATAWYGHAVAADAQLAPAHNNLGAALVRLSRFEDAEAAHRRAVALKPDFPDAHYNLGVALQDQGKFEEALASYEKAAEIKPDFVDVRWNRAYVMLTLGRYAEGWREHEWRWRRKQQPPRSYPKPIWGGEPLEGRTILLHAEQGMGDAVQFLRYVPLVAARGGRVILQVPEPLLRVAQASFGDCAQAQSDADVLPAFDLHAPLLSLPLAFGTTLETIPAEVPYLKLDEAAAARWRERVADAKGVKVGLVWAGNPQHQNDRNRSIALERLAPLFGAAEVSWFGLQVGERKADLARLPAGTVTDLSAQLTDFAETAAAIANLDLVIAVDTATAHVAGALGKPVWIMVPFVPDWRWMVGREDSPYYPSARLFRQPARGDWDSVVLRVRRALDERTGATAAKLSPDATRLLAEAQAKLDGGDPAAGEAALKAALAADPMHARAWHRLAVLAQGRGDHAVAAGFFRRTLALEPNAAEARNNLGVSLGALGRRDEAIACYRRALALRPDYAKACLNLGAALMDTDALDEAAEYLGRAAALDPKLPEAPYNLGNLAEKRGDDAGAAENFRRAAVLRPGFYEAHNNLGAVLLKAENAEAACESFARAVALKPENAEAHHNLANALADLGDYREALAACRRATALDPSHAQANFAEAMLLLIQGQLREGFEKYEWRWKLGTLVPRQFPVPLWNGEDLAGRTILLHGEQGLGDTIQGLRYVPLVAARGARVVLEVPPPLRRLAASLPGAAELVTAGQALPRFDLSCPMLSLPRAFATTLETIPADVPYLSPPSEAMAPWRARLAGPGLKIGIAWAGSPLHRSDARRSIDVETLAPLLHVEGVRWFSLQVGERAADLARLPAGLVTDLAPQLTDFAETAAAIANLDLIITVDTAVAHVAGALGRPCWVMLRFRSDWRWLIEREDSPWYPTLRLFRQRAPGDWNEVLARVRTVLEQPAGRETRGARFTNRRG
jgi:tetratricopeptide (TPR) repeat protein